MSYSRPRDSLELGSLASSEGEDEIRSISSRGFSSLDSQLLPIDEDLPAIGEPGFGSGYAPLSPSQTAEGPAKHQGKLTFWHGLGLVVGLQIGSGIFASPNQISSHAGSPGNALIVWVVGGLLAWTGAASYAELGSLIPLNGGTQAYLGKIFGSLPSFMYTWSALTILKPGSAAIIAIVAGEYFAKGFGIESAWVAKLLAVLCPLVVTTLNSCYRHLGAQAGTVFFFLKISLLLVIFVVGMIGVPKYGGSGSFSESLFSTSSPQDMALALYGSLWAYDGWDNLNFVGGEMQNAARDLPRVISTAMPTVIVAYLLANIAYFAVLSQKDLLDSTSVALTLANRVLGHIFGTCVTFAIGMSCLGALNATVFSSGHLIQSAGKEGLLPAFFGRSHPRSKSPVNALFLHFTLTSVYILVGEFRSLVSLYGASGYLFYLWAVSGLLVWRYREPDAPRTFKVWLAVPVTFAFVAIYLIACTVWSKPLMSLGMFGFVLLSVPVYYAKNYLQAARSS